MRPIQTCTLGHDLRTLASIWNGPISAAIAPPNACDQPAIAVAKKRSLISGEPCPPTSMNMIALPAANRPPSTSRIQPTRFQLLVAVGAVSAVTFIAVSFDAALISRVALQARESARRPVLRGR